VLGQQVHDVGHRPVAVRAGEELGDVLGVRRPARILFRELVGVAGLGRADELYGDEDVLLEQVGQLVAGVLAVVRDDRVADVILVPEEAGGGGICVTHRRRLEGAANGRDDVLAGPEDVVRPELSQGQPDRLFRGRHRCAPSFSCRCSDSRDYRYIVGPRTQVLY
jgi:hypothetical protein